MIYAGLFGMRFSEAGMSFAPVLPDGWGEVTLWGVRYRAVVLTVKLRGAGRVVRSFTLDGKLQLKPEASALLTGKHTIVIELSDPS